jgi:hypothetical protein
VPPPLNSQRGLLSFENARGAAGQVQEQKCSFLADLIADHLGIACLRAIQDQQPAWLGSHVENYFLAAAEVQACCVC